DGLAHQLNSAPAHAAGLRQKAQQLAVAAAHVEHLGARGNHTGDHDQIDARATGGPRRLGHCAIAIEALEHRYLLAGEKPRAAAAPSRKPRTIANSSGSS